MLLLLLSRFSRVRLCATPWTAAYQAPPSMGFSRQEYCFTSNGLPTRTTWVAQGTPLDVMWQSGWERIDTCECMAESLCRSPETIRTLIGYTPIQNKVFFNVFIFNWKIIALQNVVDFCQTSTWISHRYTYVPSLLLRSLGNRLWGHLKPCT